MGIPDLSFYVSNSITFFSYLSIKSTIFHISLNSLYIFIQNNITFKFYFHFKFTILITKLSLLD